MSYSFSIEGIKANVNKYLYWLIYIFSEKIIWLFLLIIFTFSTSFIAINNNPGFLLDTIIKNYVFMPLVYCMVGSLICMCPIILCFEYLPYYFHIKKYTENCRKNRVKYKEKVSEVIMGDVSTVLKRTITDIYTLYLDITQDRVERKEMNLAFKKHLALDNLGARNVKITSEIKSVSKKSIITITRLDEEYTNNSGVHAFESIYKIQNKQLVLKKINYIGGRNS